MKTFNRYAAQGDFIIVRIDDIPTDAIPLSSESGVHVVAHSETGHNHVIDAARVRAFSPKTPDIYTMFLQVDEPTDIVHLRSFDQHESIRTSVGKYMVRRQREYTPEGFRKAQD